MELIAEISDIDIGLKRSNFSDQVQIRKAARAIILNESNQIALLYVSENNYHKLGFQLKWMDYEQAVLLLEHDKPKDYVGRFIQKRDLLFLQKMKMYCKDM